MITSAIHKKVSGGFSMFRDHPSEGVHIHIHKSDKFRTVILQVALIWPGEKRESAVYFLLSSLLSDSCLKYPGKLEVSRRLDELYGASLQIRFRPVGNANRMSFSISACESSCVGEDILPGMFETVSEFLMRPRIENGKFPDSVFAECRKQAELTLMMAYDEPGAKADYLAAEAYGGHLARRNFPSQEELDQITNEDTVRAWEWMMEHARIDINILGNVDEDYVRTLAKKSFPFHERRCECRVEKHSPGSYACMKEVRDIPQTHVVLVYDTGHLGLAGMSPSFVIANGIFGSLPTSMLFQNIREKQGLCYSIDSSFLSMDGILKVTCAISPDHLEALLKSVQDQIDAMKNGAFSEEDVEISKCMYISNLISSYDSPGAVLSEDYRLSVCQYSLPREKLLEEFERVGKEDVVRSFQNVVLRAAAIVGPGGENA